MTLPLSSLSPAAKREHMIAIFQEAQIPLDQAQAALAKAQLPALSAEEAGAYLAVQALAPPQAARTIEGTGSRRHAVALQVALELVRYLLRMCPPEDVRAYRARKSVGQRAEAYGGALAAIIRHAESAS